jgi:hypothetical protein
MKTLVLMTLTAVLPLALAAQLSGQTGGGGRGRSSEAPDRRTLGPLRIVERPSATVDPFARYLVTPEEVLQRAAEISLTAAQRQLVEMEVVRAQSAAQAAQSRMAAETEKLVAVMQGLSIDERALLNQADVILGLERDMKHAHLAMLVRIRNALTSEQLTQLWRVHIQKKR